MLPKAKESELVSQFPKSSGVVYLVGAGPGDPGLITVRGAELLALANCVVYDALVNPKLLKHCPDAEKIYVGKRAAAHSMTQEQINAVLVEHGKAGKIVVRLKGGDPFVFGRGGEECEALANAGLRFEVVPGITAAIAAPAYAGIPVTHRDFNSSFTFITGHEKEEEYKEAEAKTRVAGEGSDIDWAAVARLPCVAFYMGVKSLPRICSKLIEHGMPSDTPAATIQRGTLPQQRTVIATLATIAKKCADEKIAPPAMTIIGKVVSLRETMGWFENRPLFGKSVVVTRTRLEASKLGAQLADLGAEVIEAPTIKIEVPGDTTAIVEALRSAHEFDWIIFTSQNGVFCTNGQLFEMNLDVRVFGKAKIAAIGGATADAVRHGLGLKVDLCPRAFVAEALAKELEDRGEVDGKRFLILRADIARHVLNERLEAGGAKEVRDIAIYETKAETAAPEELLQALDTGRVDCITFTSSSTVKNFVAMIGENRRELLNQISVASIGPITSQTLREYGLTPVAEAEQFDIAGLVDAIKKATR